MLRKDIMTAWNLIHVLEDSPRKCAYYTHKMYKNYGFRVTESSLMHILSPLAHNNIIYTKKGVGIAKSDKSSISLYEVAQALDYEFKGIDDSPAGCCNREIMQTYKKLIYFNK